MRVIDPSQIGIRFPMPPIFSWVLWHIVMEHFNTDQFLRGFIWGFLVILWLVHIAVYVMQKRVTIKI